MSKPASNNPFGSWKMILLLIMAGAVVLSLSPVSAEKPFVTIVAKGDQSYHMGEKVVFSGTNTDSNSTYLFITGPNLPDNGGKLASPKQNTSSGNPGSFTVATTKPDNTWEYTWYTSDLRLDAGTYTIYAVTRPEAKDQLTTYGTVGIVYKRPYIMAEISPASVSQGQPFIISGVAEGIPPNVQVWILGNNYLSRSIEPVNSTDASYKYVMPGEVTSKYAAGQYFAIVQHPMQDNKFNIDVSGDYVKLNNDTNLFKITGPGSLQGSDAADALITAISDHEAHDNTYTNDTYTIVPFQVTAPVSGGTGVTIAAQGDQSYYYGEEVILHGNNSLSDTTYLFITGPNLPSGGGKLTFPHEGAVSGDPGMFTAVKTRPDKTWEYTYYTANLMMDAGSFTIYAASQPTTNDLTANATSSRVSIILKRPFIMADISPASVTKGQPFTVKGTAEGIPPSVQIWIIGNNYVVNATTPVNSDAEFTFNGDTKLSGKLPTGPCYLIVQHSMQNNTFDIVASGDYVRTLQGNNGTNLFRISGPGSLQGNDAADALIAAFSDPKNGDDTYTEIPFQVTDAGSPTPQAIAATTTPVHYGLLGDLEKALRSFF